MQPPNSLSANYRVVNSYVPAAYHQSSRWKAAHSWSSKTEHRRREWQEWISKKGMSGWVHQHLEVLEPSLQTSRRPPSKPAGSKLTGQGAKSKSLSAVRCFGSVMWECRMELSFGSNDCQLVNSENLMMIEYDWKMIGIHWHLQRQAACTSETIFWISFFGPHSPMQARPPEGQMWGCTSGRFKNKPTMRMRALVATSKCEIVWNMPLSLCNRLPTHWDANSDWRQSDVFVWGWKSKYA